MLFFYFRMQSYNFFSRYAREKCVLMFISAKLVDMWLIYVCIYEKYFVSLQRKLKKQCPIGMRIYKRV